MDGRGVRAAASAVGSAVTAKTAAGTNQRQNDRAVETIFRIVSAMASSNADDARPSDHRVGPAARRAFTVGSVWRRVGGFTAARDASIVKSRPSCYDVDVQLSYSYTSYDPRAALEMACSDFRISV